MKKMMKTFWFLFVAAFCAFGAFAESEVTITSVTAQQRYPWNGKVDIAVTFTCAEKDRVEVDCTFAATNSATKAAIPVTHVTRNGDDTGSGTTWTRKYIWNAAADVDNVKIADVALTVTATLGVQLWENGPYWATCNVGATKPEECGYYFWWGDTVGYKRNGYPEGWVSVKDGSSFKFDWEKCPTYDKSDSELLSGGYINATGNLTAAHDAATVHCGAQWRMPTSAELDDLVSRCDTVWTTFNNAQGRLVMGKGIYAEKSLFLPAAGYGTGSGFYILDKDGFYWSSTPRSWHPEFANCLQFCSSYFRRDISERDCGRSVRPVRRSVPAHSVATAHLEVDLDYPWNTRTADSAGERLYYDASWDSDGATVQVYDGTILLASGVKGNVAWLPQTCANESRTLTMKILDASGSVVWTETASFSTQALGHEKYTSKEAKAPTCTGAGYTIEEKCSRCSAVVTASTPLVALGHAKYTSKTAKSPTCTAAGYTIEEKCSRCSAVLTASTTLAALGHSEKVTTAAKAATCTTAGCTKGAYCTRCNATLATSTTVAALGHSEKVTTAARAATCTTAGCTKGSSCTRCNATLSTSTTLAALGHSEKVTTAAKAATCTTAGCTKGSYCTRCNATLSTSTTLAALGHAKYTSKAAKAPTCTAAGCTIEEKCSRCSAVLTASTTLAALGHSEKVTTAAKAATCTAAGCTKGSYCTRCNATLATSTPLAALGHAKYTSKVAKAPTCTTSGWSAEERCSRCKAVLTASVTIPAHNTSVGVWPESAVEIMDGAFEGCKLLTRIDLSRNTKLKRIGKRAFAECWLLKEVILPPNLEVIDDEAFASCYDVKQITLPPSVVTIGAGAFENCSDLSAFYFTGELVTLAARTFRGCSELQKITLPDGLTTIRESAFEGCRRMQSIILPLSLSCVESLAFDGCDSLTGVTLPSHVAPMNSWFSSIYTQIRDVQIVSGSTAIVDDFFSGCSSLESVVIPQGIRTIGARAFKGCSSLPNARLPNTLTTIGASSFHSCSSLASIVIPDTVTSIGNSCFYNCWSLHDVTLSRQLTELPDYLFYGCWSLDSFTVPENVAKLGKRLVTKIHHQGEERGPTDIYFLGYAPAYAVETYLGAMPNLTTYIKEGTRGWDGRAGSRDLPAAWPTTGESRTITHWTAHQFDVSYRANGGTFVENGAAAYDCLCTTTELYAVPPGNPQRAGYKFAGWWTEPNGGTQITASTPVVLMNAHTLYAHWEAAVTINVRFNANGGTVKPGEKICVAGETFGQLPVPTREHFAFAGWYTQARGGYEVVAATEVPQADRELFAHWVEATYIVRFHSNDGRDETYDQYYTYGSSFNLATCRFTNGVRQFNGWARTASGSTVYAENALFREFGAIETNIIHLYAVWIGDAWVIRFDSNGGDGAMDNQTINVGETKPLAPNVFTRPGWVFTGWSTTYNGPVVYKDRASVKDLTTAKNVVVLFAVWQKGASYLIRFIRNDGAGTMATSTFTCGVSERLPTVAQLNFPRRGYDFGGWATTTANARNGIAWRQDGATVKDATTAGKTLDVYAIWRLKSDYYEIRFEKNDGTGKWRALGYEYGKATALPSIDAGLGWSRAGYTFKGWATSATGAVWKGDKATVATAAAKGKTLVVYAIWEKEVPSYKIRFIRNDGAGTLATNTFACGVSTSLPTVVKLNFARRGYDFGGWATTTANARNGVAWKQDGAVVKDATTAGKMLDIYAIWRLKSDYYEIRFEKNDGTGKWRALGYEYGKATALPSIDAGLGWARAGYTFKGWATSATGAVWKGDKATVATAAAKGKTLVVYAIWAKATVKSAAVSPSAAAIRSAASAKASTNVGATENSETTSDCLAGDLATGDGTYLLWLDPDPSTGVLLVMPLEGDPVCEPVTLTERGQALTDRGQTLEAETVGGEVYWLAR